MRWKHGLRVARVPWRVRVCPSVHVCIIIFELYPGKLLLSTMSSVEPGRRKAYTNDLRWRIVYQRIGMHLPLEKIASNLNVSTSTAYRINARFRLTGSVDSEGPQKRRPDLRRLDEHSQLFVVGLVLGNPSLYLGEVCQKVLEVDGVNVSPSTICRLSMYGITRKKMRYVALQRCESFRGAFMAQSFMFSTDKFVVG